MSQTCKNIYWPATSKKNQGCCVHATRLQALQEVVIAFAPNQISHIWMRGTHALLPNMLKKKIVVGI